MTDCSDDYLATTAPPADMLPFLGRPGAYSFAGRIFWAVLERTMTAMDELAMLQPAAETEEAGQQQLAVVTLRPGAGFHRVVERMGGGGPSTTQHRITYLAAVHEARAAQGGCCCESSDGGGGGDATSALTAMNTGTTGSSVESSSQQWLSDLVAREYSYYGERGRRRAPMLSMTDIEHRVRKMLGEDAFAVVARATVEDWERGGGGGGGHHAAAGKNAGVVDGLLRRLTDTWVCFGEGPRWDVQLFETIMRDKPELAREVIDTLAATRRHHILGLSRGWKQTAYEDQAEMVGLLTGVHALLCFWDPTRDARGEAQKRLVDAAIEAGVERFAPSEWSMGEKLEDCMDSFPWYSSKLAVREYLYEINKTKKVIQYSLFQPGSFMEYLGHPQQTCEHVVAIPMLANLPGRRIIGLEGHLGDAVTYTSVRDIAGVVAAAVEYEGEWPVVGGIQGDRLSLEQLQEIGERIQGKPFRRGVLKQQDVEAGVLALDDLPRVAHPSIPEDQVEAFSNVAVRGMLLSTARGGWTTTSEWNELLPDYKFMSVEDFAKKLSL
ncbi:hypothetical protein GGR56DRAFT_674358 [Xylariaceae sp. FL0804]|nr:hypothetical protein GGR56DRAFT_674358 [Xylariaceae sp. FL0804]